MKVLSDVQKVKVAFLILLLPFILLCFYSHPAADDFPLSHTARDWGSYTTVVGYYKCWSARFTSIFLMSVNPLAFGSFAGYKLIPVLLIAGLTAAMRYFVFSILGKRAEGNILFLLISLLFLLSMVDLPGGLYYLGGSLFYQPGNILLVILAGNLVRQPPPTGLNGLPWQDWAAGIFQGVLLFLLAGCNEIGMLLGLGITFGGFAAQLITRKKFSAGWSLLLLVSAAACLLILLSPATHYRMEASGSNTRALSETAFLAFGGLLACLLRWFSSPSLSIVLLTIFVFWPAGFLNKVNTRLVCIQISIASLLLFYICFLPSYLGEGMLQGRTENSLLFLFILLSTFNLALWKNHISMPEQVFKLKPFLLTLSFISLLLAPAFRLAVGDLWSGEAAAYSGERDVRHRLMQETHGDTVRIPAIRHKPKSLFAGDIGDYPEPWYDNHFAALYGKKWVELQKPGKLPK
jgi:hypothetical protein